MATRLDYFYFDGTRTHCVYSEVTAEILYNNAVAELRDLHATEKGQWPECWLTTPLRTIVKSSVTEGPWL